ncbi:MAG: hypothetical protein H6716_25220 [Polyangiaceae bacterium]|nr:hypothetical protein [Polyangiaceae bacterium]
MNEHDRSLVLHHLKSGLRWIAQAALWRLASQTLGERSEGVGVEVRLVRDEDGERTESVEIYRRRLP